LSSVQKKSEFEKRWQGLRNSEFGEVPFPSFAEAEPFADAALTETWSNMRRHVEKRAAPMNGFANVRLPASFLPLQSAAILPFLSIMRSIFRVLVLALLVSPFCSRAEVRPDDETLEREIGPALKHIGDFALSDSKGEVFAVGRILVDFTSIYTLLAKNPGAEGECEFMYSPIKNGQKGKGALHRMRYFIRLGNSRILFNTDAPGKELELDFKFDPTKEFAEGTIRKDPFEPIAPGTCRIRFQDPAP
jgi:hypothetical protein